LLERQPDLLTHLATVRGCEQMIVRVFGSPHSPEPDGTPTLSGTQYLRDRARRLQPPEVLTELAQAPRTLTRDSRVEGANQPGVLGTVYHLIGRGQADEYRIAMSAALGRHPDLHASIRGPLPAYAFT
jgi:hypothetical protein